MAGFLGRARSGCGLFKCEQLNWAWGLRRARAGGAAWSAWQLAHAILRGAAEMFLCEQLIPREGTQLGVYLFECEQKAAHLAGSTQLVVKGVLDPGVSLPVRMFLCEQLNMVRMSDNARLRTGGVCSSVNS